jgi:Tfp pilus assembly protein PilF
MKRIRRASCIFQVLACLCFFQTVLNCQVYEPTVTSKLLLGTVLIAGDDLPAEQVTVELWNAAGAPVASTVTGWGGEFHFAGIDPGEYLLSAGKIGFESTSAKVQIPLDENRVTLRLKRLTGAGQAVVSARDLIIPVKAQVALRDGINLLKSDLPRAIASLQHAIALFPNYYEAYHVLGMANLTMGRLPEASEAFRWSIELSDHQYARPLLALGAILCDQGRFAEAESKIREGLQLDDTPWIGHLLLARALFGLNRWDDAEVSAREAILREPDVADAYLLLAHIHARQRNEAAVPGDLEEFLKVEPHGTISDKVRAVQSIVASRSDLR